jgi:hypothetical protein
MIVWQQISRRRSIARTARRKCRGHRAARPATDPRIAAAAGLGQDQDLSAAATASVNQTRT